MDPDSLTARWTDLWGGAAAYSAALDDCPDEARAFFKRLAEYRSPSDLDGVEVEFATLSRDALTWITGALRRLEAGTDHLDDDDPVRAAVLAVGRRALTELCDREQVEH